MTTVDIPVGSPVFVCWYGKIVQGETIDRKGHCDWPPLAEWIPIRMEIPNSEGNPIVPGVRNICMFHMKHVYASAEEAQQAENDFRLAVRQMPAPVVTPSSPAPQPAAKPTSEAWQAIQKFKEEQWDQERNHLRIDAIEEFYRLWRASVAAKYGVTIEDAPSTTVVAVDPGSPDGDHSAEYIVDTETGEIVSCAEVSKATGRRDSGNQQPQPPIETVEQIVHHPIVSEERYQELKEKMKVKLTKKQKNSTGRIEYTDSIQTSFFD